MTTAAELGRDINRSIARTTASLAARDEGETRYWYFIHTDYCPVCGRDETTRERIYGERPEADEDRRSFHESYDYCDAL